MAKFFVTTAIPYVNDKPHLGHAMEFIEADVLARYHRQQGDNVLFATGTDEHGNKILEKARASQLEPQQFVDSILGSFQSLIKLLDVRYDQFVRTTDPRHIEAAQYIWQKLAADIFKQTYESWYCTGSEEFVSQQVYETNKGVCPDHQRPYEKIVEENYFFRLSKYTKPILEAIEKDQLSIMPETRKHEIVALLRTGLEDISFSRPKTKVPWGIEVPGDAGQVMYVWPEALTNYLTATGYPAAGFSKWWPADVHVIGKDVLRFHAAIWPAMLLAAGLELPKAIYVHGFINVDGKKMSKSLGNAIDPVEVINRYGSDAFRYYFLHEIPSYEDGDFTWERLSTTYNSVLANDLGNLVQRIAKMVDQYQKGVIGETTAPSHDIKPYHQAVANFQFDKALDEIWALVRGLNQYIDEEKPWQLFKNKDIDHLAEVLAYTVSNSLGIGQLLAPFLPQAAAKIEKTFADGLVHADVGMLFPRIDPVSRPTQTPDAD